MVFNLKNGYRYVLHKYLVADNFIFYLCYRWTVLLLVVFSFIVTCVLVLGDSFSCSPDSSNTECYESGVFTKPAELFPDIDIPALNLSDSQFKEFRDFRRYLYYYQWVNLLFLIMAFNFYLPHLLWKSYEGGYIRRLSAGVEKFFDKEENRELQLCYLAKYVLVTQGKHKLYTYLYIFFETCNFGISLAQTLWLVHFFNVTGVPEALPIPLRTWFDFRTFYFPLKVYCHVYRFDDYGDSVRSSNLCFLPMNKLYMRMFLFLHAWFIFLTILCGIVLIYRIALLVSSLRIGITKYRTPLAEKSILKSLCYRLSYSDWFFLTRLQKTMIDVDFAQLVDKIAVVSQGKSLDLEKGDDPRSCLYEDGHKELDNSAATSPL